MKERQDLTNEAIKIHGQFIEDIVPGYVTQKTTGRKSLDKTLTTYTVGAADGDRLSGSKFPSRDIKVEYFIYAPNEEALIEKFNQLNNVLNVEETDFIFNDEPDKFFTGTAVMDGDVEQIPVMGAGSFTIHCGYPCKRSIVPKTLTSEDASGVIVTDTDATFTFNYTGTYPARPLLRALFAAAKDGGDYSEDGDCGFVAFLDPSENIIQLGNPDVLDVDQYAKNNTLANSEFSALTDWTASGVSVANITDTYWNKGKGQTLKFAKPSGTASLKRTTAGKVDYEFDIVQRLCVSAANQTGTFEALTKNNGKIVAGYRIKKTGNGTTGVVEYILNDRVVGQDNIDLSYYNTHFGYCNRTAVYTQQTYYVTVTKKVKKKKKKVKEKRVRTVQSGWNYTQSNLNSGFTKDGAVVTFSVGNLPDRTYKDGAIESMAGIDIEFNFTGSFHTNAIHSCAMIGKAGVPFAEIPNVFTAGDIVEADCNDANVTLYRDGSIEGHLEPQYGALGNDWEDFVLRPGQNTIRAVWSDWVDPAYKPKIEIEFNEVYL